MTRHMTIIAATLIIAACTNKDKDVKDGQAGNIQMKATVETMTLRRTSFASQIVCNGKLKALAHSQLSFAAQDIVTSIYVHNGSRVAKGQLLAVTDKRGKAATLNECERNLEKAAIDLSDKLIGLGYDGNGNDVPADVMHRAKLTSGYLSSQHSLSEARKALADCELRAPFAGRIANMECQPFQKADKFGVLIDDSFFDVEFNILETELPTISIGDRVKVVPMTDENKTFNGSVVRINPMVNEDGVIKVEARIRNTDRILIDGMNVKVIIEKDVANQLVVPKSAVVERDGYHVIFVVEDSMAVWTYVDVVHSNINSHAIAGCMAKDTKLQEGMEVIVSNNQNLADGTVVKRKETKR